MTDEQDSWSHHELLVTRGLEQVQKDVRQLRNEWSRDNIKIATEIATLRAKANEQARLWGLISGAIPALIMLLISQFLKD